MSPALVIALLALLLGMQPLTTDLYLPALPMVSTELGATVAQAQSTFTGLLLAFGCSQLLWGPASDRWGRRPILLTGLALYILAAAACMLAPSMSVLVMARVAQGMALGAAVVAARAIVRDLYAPVEGTQVMSKAMTGLGVLACSSPLVGSLLATHLGWRPTMAALMLAGVATWVIVWLYFQESVQHRNPNALQLRLLLSNWQRIGQHPTFLAYTLSTSCSYAGLVVFLTGTPFMFMQVLGWSATQVGLLLSCNGLVYLLGTILCRRLLRRWGVQKAIAIAGGIAVACGALLLLLAFTGSRNPWAYAAVCMLYPIAHGIQQPCGQSGAVSSFPQAAGTASALNGFVMMIIAFATGQILGAYSNGTVYPLVFGMATWCAAAALASWTLVRRYGAPSTS